MRILDLKKELKHLYAPSAKKVEILHVPRLQFALIDGAIEKGSEPGNSPSFQEATQALYSLSYTLKFMLKKRKTNAIDYLSWHWRDYGGWRMAYSTSQSRTTGFTRS